jgi:hypothetical protein
MYMQSIDTTQAYADNLRRWYGSPHVTAWEADMTVARMDLKKGSDSNDRAPIVERDRKDDGHFR